MAIVYSYPLNKNIKLSDELVGTTEIMVNNQLRTVTRNFLLEDLSSFFIANGGIQKTITLTTTGTSGAATLNQLTGVLNIPQYSGGGGSQNLQQVTDIGSTTTNPITANSFIKTGGSGSNVLLDNGTTLAISSIIGSQNLQQVLDIGNTTDTGIIMNIANAQGVLINLSEYSVGFAVSTVGGADLSYPLIFTNEYAVYFQVDNGGNLLSLGSLEAYSFVKSGGLSTEYLMADGSVTTGGIGGVPYTGATENVDLGEFGLLAGNIQLDNTPTNIPTAAGSIYWNDTDGTADLIMKGGNVKLQIGQESVIRVVNKTATNITLLESNYQAVRVTGAQGQRLKVDLAQATSDALSAETIGLVTETIANNQEGFITTSGLVRSINTTGSLQGETWADGDTLYLSPTVAGRITKIKPSAPNHLVIIGYVVYAHANDGTIFVKVDNGYELDELHNVKITSPQFNGEVLQYNGITTLWENKNLLVGDADFGNDNNTYNSTLLSTLFGSKQETLVSGTTIKTINGSSVLGSGNLVITAPPASQGAFTILANNTNSSAVPTEKVYKEVAEQSLSGTGMSATGGTLPSGTQTHFYRWSQIGNLITVRINLQFGTAGTCSGIAIPFANMPDIPQTPQHPSIYATNGDVITYGSGSLVNGKSFPIFTVANGTSAIRKAPTGSTYEFLVGRASGSYANAWIHLQYYI